MKILFAHARKGCLTKYKPKVRHTLHIYINVFHVLQFASDIVKIKEMFKILLTIQTIVICFMTFLAVRSMLRWDKNNLVIPHQVSLIVFPLKRNIFSLVAK